MEQTQDATPAAPAAPPAAAATPAAPIEAKTESAAPANPFKAQIEQAKKDWEDISKAKDAKEDAKPPEPPPPPKEEPKPKKPLDYKNEAIKKAKSDMAKIQERAKILEARYRKAMEDKDETAAKIAQSQFEEAQSEFDSATAAEGWGNYSASAEAEGTVQNIEQFVEDSQYYLPILSANPAIANMVMSSKYPYASLENLFFNIANNGWDLDKFVNTPPPTLRLWINAICKITEERLEKKSTPTPATPPAAASAKPVPPSVVATTSGDPGSEPALKTEGASMEDVIRHIRKYGGKGIG